MDQRSDVERIKEYKELLDEGMITREEFEAKKKKILEEDEAGKRSSFEENVEKLSTKVTNVLGYITWVGFLIAYFAGDREHCMFHLNQGLVLNIFGLLMFIPLVGWIARIGYVILMIIGVVNASSDVNKPLPLIGTIKLL